MRFYDLNSTQMEGIIKAQFIDESRWSVQPYWNYPSDDPNFRVKAVKIIWTPSTLVFNYLLRKKNEAVKCTPYSAPTLFSLRHVGHNNPRDPQYWWRIFHVSCDVTYNTETHSIVLDWWFPWLSCTDVNDQIEGLTAQHVHIILKIPYFEGLVIRTHGTKRWQRRPASQGRRYDNPTYPVWHQFKLNCYISSHRGVYARNKGSTYAQRTIVPLYCIYSTHNDYHTHHQGKYVVQLQHDDNVYPLYCECMTWGQATKRLLGGWRVDQTTNNIEYRQTRNDPWAVLYDSTTREPVKATDYITAAHYYNY